jgi:hypothetical protein
MIINIFLTGTTILIKNVVFGKINKKYVHKKIILMKNNSRIIMFVNLIAMLNNLLKPHFFYFLKNYGPRSIV